MKKVLYGLFAVVLVAVLVLGILYINVTTSQTTSQNADSNESDFVPAVGDDPYSNVETQVFVASHFAFAHPRDWKPTEEPGTGLVNLGIPVGGILVQTISFENGNYDNIISISKSLPDLSAEGYVTLVDRDGYLRSRFNEQTNVETYEFFAPGRTDQEVVVLRVEVSRDTITGTGLDSYLFELFQGLTITS